MGEWQAIETAPKGYTPPYSKRVDASQFLLLWNGYHRGVGYGELSDDDCDDAVHWWSEDGCPIEPRPTHWMPLPEPPENHE